MRYSCDSRVSSWRDIVGRGRRRRTRVPHVRDIRWMARYCHVVVARTVFPDPIALSSQNDASPHIVARNAADRQISPARSAEYGASTSIRRTPTRERRKSSVGVCDPLTFARWGFSRLSFPYFEIARDVSPAKFK